MFYSNNLESDLDKFKINCIVVSTMTPSHKDYVILAIKKGIPVFTEKPLTSNLKDGKECYEIYK